MSRATSFNEVRIGARGNGGAGSSRLVPLLRRSWLKIALPTLAAAACAGLFVQAVPERYTAEAKILLEGRESALARALPGGDGAPTIDGQTVASQVQVAQSREIARQAIRALNLIGHAEFDPVAGEIGAVRRVLMMLGLAKNPLVGPPEDRILDAYHDRLLVSAVGPSRVLAFEFRAGDPELAAKAANTVAELYIASLASTQAETARSAASALGGSVDALRTRLVDSEAKLEAFRTRHGFFGSDGASQALGTQQIAEISGQLAQARTNRADLVGRVKVLKDMIKEGRAFEMPDVANNVLIRRTVETRITLRAQLALESRTLLPAHPRIKELTAQVADLDAQIKAAAERIVRSLENDTKIANARVESLQAASEGQSTVMGRSSGSEAELRALEREVKLQREQLDGEIARYREAAARDGATTNPVEARMIARAVAPEEASFPKKLPTLAVATALAFLLSAGTVLGRGLRPTPPAAEHAGATNEDAAADARPAADPERLAYPEPLPPGIEPAIEPVSQDRVAIDAPPSGEDVAAPAEIEAPSVTVEAAAVTATFVEVMAVQVGGTAAMTDAASTEPGPSGEEVFEAETVALEAADEDGIPVVTEADGAAPIVALDEDAVQDETVEPAAEAERDASVPPVEAETAAPRDEAAIEEALVAAAAHWEAMQARTAEPEAPTRADAPEEAAYDFTQLIERLQTGPSHGAPHGGRTVLVVETRPGSDRKTASMVESLARLLASRTRTLWVDVNGSLSSEDDPGLSDVVTAEADFLDAIHNLPGTRLHAIGPGSFETERLLEEPEGLAIALNAMAQAYEWVICRIDATSGEGAHLLISAVAASTDAVVIVSEADGNEEELVALYGLAEEAGTGQILIAQGWAPAAERPAEDDMALRLTAA